MQLMQVNQTSSTSSNGTVQAKAEVAMVHTLNNFLNDMINNISITPLQDFQLLKAPCNEPACSIYSNKITTATAEAAASCKSRSVFACHKLIRMYDNLIVYRFYQKKKLIVYRVLSLLSMPIAKQIGIHCLHTCIHQCLYI